MAKFTDIPLSLFCGKISQKLNTKDICSLELTCKQFKRYLSENFWKRYNTQNFIPRKRRKTSKQQFAKRFKFCKTSSRNDIVSKYKRISSDCYTDKFQSWMWNVWSTDQNFYLRVLFDLKISTNYEFQKQKLFKEIKYESSLFDKNEKISLFLKIMESETCSEGEKCIKKIFSLFPKQCETQFSLKFQNGKEPNRYVSFHLRFVIFSNKILPEMFNLILETFPDIGKIICNFVDKIGWNIFSDIIGQYEKNSDGCKENCNCMKFINVIEKFMGRDWISQKLRTWSASDMFIAYCNKHVQNNFTTISDFAQKYSQSIEYSLKNYSPKKEKLIYSYQRACAVFYGCTQCTQSK